MARIFTITEGVENMGALKTGGQGSVYKGRRIGEIITAIKILPTPIYSETGDDKNFTSFQNEVQKLKKVNEDANPNVVTILSSGITESGNFPFIEMEYIDGPDLGELLTPPHEMIFTIKEALKVADQLSNALAHCHNADVKHGDIKSNNVKFNTQNGNYILLDFGLSVMSDEQRRTSLRQAGAVEFMAPEQHEGQLLFETEVYSFGIIMFELLSGTVPFPVQGNGETARNAVMIAHLETAPPNLLSLRKQNLPAAWSEAKKETEMQVPEWLLSMIYKCLEKNPVNRFNNGEVLHEYIVRNSILASGHTQWGADRIIKLEQENENLVKQNKALQQQLSGIGDMKPGLQQNSFGNTDNNNFKPVKKVVRMRIMLIVLCLLSIIAVIGFFINSSNKKRMLENQQQTLANAGIHTIPLTEDQSFQLKKAGNLLAAGRIEASKVLYKSLAAENIPEAMYEYGNLTLLNNSGNINCEEAINYLIKAASKGHVLAKRTVGLLYSFAADKVALKQKGYQGCDFVFDIKKGAKFLMEATLAGDNEASLLLDEINAKYGTQ
ncbi:MAG: protein kinase [Ferruginibacter sp.]